MAALALTAVVASAAQAAPEFRVATAPAIIKGEQVGTQSFSTVNGNVTCTTATFNGTSNVTATTSQILTPTYEGCNAFGSSANVTTTGCTYTFALVKSSSPPTANVNINCEAGKVITVSALGGCTTTVGSQNGKSHVVFSNTANSPTDIDANVTVEGITYTASGCIFNGTFNTGKVTGEATIRAYSGNVQQNLSVS
ncbi:MAG TPA: hypothetical protein VFI17_06515 [Solirubrobacterales bacterium]|nr:hypothetical protein [Solirubrobacterales bacterium]